LFNVAFSSQSKDTGITTLFRAIILQRFDTFVPTGNEDFPKSVVPRNFNEVLTARTQIPSFTAEKEGGTFVLDRLRLK